MVKKNHPILQLSNFGNIVDENITLYDAKYIWNCDKTGLQCKNSPTKSYVTIIDLCKGTKAINERVTILLCCSLLGEKYALFIISKSKSPRCLKNYDIEKSNVRYLASSNFIRPGMREKLFICGV